MNQILRLATTSLTEINALLVRIANWMGDREREISAMHTEIDGGTP